MSEQAERITQTNTSHLFQGQVFCLSWPKLLLKVVQARPEYIMLGSGVEKLTSSILATQLCKI